MVQECELLNGALQKLEKKSSWRVWMFPIWKFLVFLLAVQGSCSRIKITAMKIEFMFCKKCQIKRINNPAFVTDCKCVYRFLIAIIFRCA